MPVYVTWASFVSKGTMLEDMLYCRSSVKFPVLRIKQQLPEYFFRFFGATAFSPNDIWLDSLQFQVPTIFSRFRNSHRFSIHRALVM